MRRLEKIIIPLVALMLAAAVLAAPVLAAESGTTELRIVKYANDRTTILNEMTVDYHWLEKNLPVQGDGVTRYYHQGPVFEGEWEKVHPDKPYDGWNPGEDVRMSVLYKADFGAVKGTDLKDICNHIGGAVEGDEIKLLSRDGYTKTFPYSIIYEPDPRQGPAVICWYSGEGSGPDTEEGKEQGQGYPDTGYVAGMRMIFFGDTSTNPWGWHIFGNTDMKECWDKKYWSFGGSYPSTAGTSPKWVSEVRIYSQEPPGSAAAEAQPAAGASPAQETATQPLAPGGSMGPLALLGVVLWSIRYKKQG
ncbi:MAG: argininosuccinate synthase [Methanoculleus sp.]|nr:argininosuccinate synthase [Methanoculleus sp.]